MATTTHSQIEPDDEDFIRPEIIQSYIDKFNKVGLHKRHTKESLDWFRKRVSKDLRYNRQRLIKNFGDYKRRTGNEKKTLVGRLYYYQYEAMEAGDKVNNVYDQYPMVFVFNTSRSNEGHNLIHALNIHYLQPKEKALLFLALMRIKGKQNFSHATKLKLSWKVIEKFALNSSIAKKAVHSYRVDRIKSKLIEIHAEDWEIATFLRLEHWVHIDGDQVDQKDIRAAHRTK